MRTPRVFTPSAAVTHAVIALGLGGARPMPAPDAGNTAVTVTNDTGGPIHVNFGTQPDLPARPDMRELPRVLPGETLLIEGGPAATATYVAAWSALGGSITIKRGTSAVQTEF